MRRDRYELCAKYGLYVVDEANYETHGFDPSLRYNEMVPANNPQVKHLPVLACVLSF